MKTQNIIRLTHDDILDAIEEYLINKDIQLPEEYEIEFIYDQINDEMEVEIGLD